MRVGTAFLALIGLLSASSAAAQTATSPPPTVAPQTAPPRAAVREIKGTILSNDGQSLTVQPAGTKTATAQITVPFDEQTIIVRYERRQLSDVHTGDFLAVSALVRTDGTFRAARINLFPADEPHRGVSEGRGDNIAGIQGRSNINGTVSDTSVTGNSGTLKLTYHGTEPSDSPTCEGYTNDAQGRCSAEVQIAVMAGVPVTGIVDSDTSALAPGTPVSITALPDEANKAYAITVQ